MGNSLEYRTFESLQNSYDYQDNSAFFPPALDNENCFSRHLLVNKFLNTKEPKFLFWSIEADSNVIMDPFCVETVNYWKSKKIDIEDSKYINLVYLGTFGNSIYLDEIILAFKSINKDNLRLILCGSGDNEKHLKKMANNHPNIFFPGYVKSKNIKTLLVNSHIGLCPYVNSEMYLSSLPGKVIEYLSEGLFLLSSLKEGFVGNMINKNNLGSNYEIYQKQSFIHALKGIIKLIESEKHDRQKIIKFFQENYSNEIVFKNYYNHIMKTINTYV